MIDAPPPRVIQTRHVLAVQDLRVSADYFIHVLGFQRDFAIPECWEFLSLGSFKVMLGECPDAMAAHQTGDHSYFAHVLVEDVDALFHDCRERGAMLLFSLEDKPWGLREFGVQTPDGHRIVFGEEIEQRAPK